MTTSNGACHAYALWSAWLFGSWNSTIRCTLANLKQKENQVQDDAGCARMGVNHAFFGFEDYVQVDAMCVRAAFVKPQKLSLLYVVTNRWMAHACVQCTTHLGTPG